METVSVFQIIFCIILWLVLVLPNANQFSHKSHRGTGIIFLLFIVTVFCVWDFYGDYINYRMAYQANSSNPQNSGFEPVFQWLMKIIPDNYSLWRFSIWFPSVILLGLTIKKLQLSPQFASLMFALTVMVYFGAPRNTLGYMALYCGAAYILTLNETNNKIINILIGGMLIFSTLFLHSSMFLYIFLFLVALIPFKKWMYIISIIIFPILYHGFQHIIPITLDAIVPAGSVDLATDYLESDFRANLNFMGIIQRFINRIPFFILLFYSIYHIYFKKDHYENYRNKVFLQQAYLLMYLSYLFNGQAVSAFLSPRFWDAAIYPLFFFLSTYLFDKRKKSRIVRLSLYLMVIMNVYTFMYALYKS